MIKVKEYLDKYFHSSETSTAELKDNGHYEVHGLWIIPEKHGNDWIRCNINNETLVIAVCIDGKSAGYYGYLQTYEHIPRGLPDKHGYYARSTDEEIIKYIELFFKPVGKK